MSSVVPRTARLQTLFAASSPRDGKGTAGAAEHVLALQLATIAEIGTRIASARTVEAILNVVASEARWLLSFGRCTLALVTTDTRYYRALTLDTAKHGSYSAEIFPRTEGFAGWVLEHRQALRLSHPEENLAAEPSEQALLLPQTRSVLILPLIADGTPIGTVNFSAARPNAYPVGTLAIARLLALQIGGAVAQALLLEDLDSSETVILSLAHAIEAKDPTTEGHCRRLAQHAEQLGRALGFSGARLRILRMGATLHDVGKIAIPEAILDKPGALTAAEYAIMQRHPIAGAEICAPLRSARDLIPAIRHHHERWDGTGYPDHLAGEAIPLDARIIAIVDAYDAMTSDRPYRRGLPVEKALAIMRENRGPQWDPTLLAIFLTLIASTENSPPRAAGASETPATAFAPTLPPSL